MTELLFIDQPTTLQDLTAALQGTPWLALDTEFYREKTYFPQLCLVQIATADMTACIDPLALPDLIPLQSLLGDRQTVKVFHAAAQDIEALLQHLAAAPFPLFDTQIAAALLGYGDQPGYARLVRDLLGVKLDKSQTRTDWARRPLLPAQLAYAADDVRYLGPIYQRLTHQLKAKGRLDWLTEDFASLADSLAYRPNPETAWQRIRGIHTLHPRQLAILRGLAAWRENLAVERNQPRKHLASDEGLLALVRQPPSTLKQLQRNKGIPAAITAQHGEQLLRLMAEAQSLPATAWPPPPRRQPLTPSQEALADAALAILRTCAAQQAISLSMLGGRSQIERYLRGERRLPLFTGWRYHVAGQPIEAFLQGRLQLQVVMEQLALRGL